MPLRFLKEESVGSVAGDELMQQLTELVQTQIAMVAARLCLFRVCLQ
jgi:hypothetical protein